MVYERGTVRMIEMNQKYEERLIELGMEIRDLQSIQNSKSEWMLIAGGNEGLLKSIRINKVTNQISV